jgi:hypothetical protein
MLKRDDQPLTFRQNIRFRRAPGHGFVVDARQKPIAVLLQGTLDKADLGCVHELA